jgi:hypothetical protein
MLLCLSLGGRLDQPFRGGCNAYEILLAPVPLDAVPGFRFSS